MNYAYDQRYKLGVLLHINQFPTTPPYQFGFTGDVFPNRKYPYIWGWVINSEPETQSGRPGSMEIYWNQQFWATNLIAGTYIDTAQQTRMNEFMFSDFFGWDTYPAATALTNSRAFMDSCLDNCEPFAGTYHSLVGDPGQSATATDFMVNDEFYFPLFSGGKGILWYGYRGTGSTYTKNSITYSGLGGAFHTPTNFYYTNFLMMRHCNREFVQIRNLCLYSGRGLTNANYSGAGAITQTGGTDPSKWQAKMLVGEEAVVMGLINWAASATAITNQTNVSVAFSLPSWIPPQQVYEVTPVGKVPCAWSASGQRITITNITIRDTVIFVAGKNDTNAPAAPTDLTVAIQRTNNTLTYSWRESSDNFGVMGYRVYTNGVQVADLQCPVWTNAPIPPAGTIITVKAYDSATNLSAASVSYKYSGSDLIGQWFTGAASLADVSGYTPAGTHDGMIVGANPGALAYSADVPPGSNGMSLDLTANGLGSQVGVAIKNSSTRDPSYRPTFDDEIKYGFRVSFWYKGTNTDGEGVVGKRGVEGGNPQRIPDYNTGWAPRKSGANWTLRVCSSQAADTFDGYGATSGGTPFDGNWHKFEAVWNGQTGNRQCYLDGALVLDEGANSSSRPNFADYFGGMMLPSVNHMGIGVRESVDPRIPDYEWYPRNGTNFAYTGWFVGKIYDVRVYKEPQLTLYTAVAGSDNVTLPDKAVRLRIPVATILAMILILDTPLRPSPTSARQLRAAQLR